MRSFRLLPSLLVLLCLVSTGIAAPAPSFSFAHISDVHVGPAPRGSKSDGSERGGDVIAWFCEEVKRPQVLQPLGVTAPPPAFVINTGDFTEFGVIGNTWKNVERLFKPLAVPMYISPGNHDNTWNSMLQIMWERYGGDNYSFDKFGCHFVGLCTATPQEPLPSIDQRLLTWLAADLKKVRIGTPIFMFCHHPLSSTEFCKPYEQLRLLDVIRGHNVVAMLMGHGHQAVHQRWGELDSVEGGSTFGDNAGYSILSVQDGILRVVYRYKNPEKPMKTLLVKPLTPRKWPRLDLLAPANGTLFSGAFKVEVRPRVAAPIRVVARIDDSERREVLMARSGQRFQATMPVDSLTPGAHFLRITGDFDPATTEPAQMNASMRPGASGAQLTAAVARRRRGATSGTTARATQPAPYQDDRAVWFVYSPPGGPSASRAVLSAGMKAAPVINGRDVLVATTAGEICSVSFESAQSRVQRIASVGAVVLSPPALTAEAMYVGAADMAVHAFDLRGKRLWKRTINGCAYGTPAVDEKRVYVADLEGFVHAIDRRSGLIVWSNQHASMGVEHSPLLHQDVLYFGSWDGYVYAVNAADGTLRWRQPAPSSFAERKYANRYYSPADAPPVIVGQRLFVTDRAYVLGSYSLDGKYLGQIATQIAGIGPTADGKGLLVRGMATLSRYDAEGNSLWSKPLSLGRFPVPPVEAAGKVYVCSNRGLLSVHDAESGEPIWQYQVTPQLPVMGAVAVDAGGAAYVTGMDGTIARVLPGKSERRSRR